MPVVTAAAGDDAIGPIRAVSMFKQAPVYIYGRAFWGEEKESTMDGQTFTLHAGDVYSSDYTIKLAGEHQIANASVAIVVRCISALPIPSGPEGWSALAKSRMLF